MSENNNGWNNNNNNKNKYKKYKEYWLYIAIWIIIIQLYMISSKPTLEQELSSLYIQNQNTYNQIKQLKKILNWQSIEEAKK